MENLDISENNDKNNLVKLRSRPHLIISLVVTVAIIIIVYEKLNYADIANKMVAVDLRWITCAFMVNVVILFIWTMRWEIILSPLKKANFINLFSASSIGLLGNNFLPARMGELLRIFVISKRENISRSRVAATIFIEKICISISLLIMMLCLYPFLLPSEVYFADENLHDVFAKGLIVFFIVNLFIVLGIVFFPKYRPLGSEIIKKIFSFLPSGWYEKFHFRVLLFLEGFGIIKKKSVAFIALLSFSHWGLWALRLFFILRAFDVRISFINSFLVIFCIFIAMGVSSIPGHIGPYHVGGVVGLVLLNVEINTAVSIAIVLHGIPFIVSTLAGMLFMWRENIQLFHLSRTAKMGIYNKDLETL